MPSLSAPTERSSHPARDRATWVWHLNDPELLVASAARRGLSDLFVHVSAGVQGPAHRVELARHERLARLARPSAIRVWALGGDPAWLSDPEAAVAWQRASLDTGCFVGSHLGLEPWALAEWGGRERAELISSWGWVAAELQNDSSMPLHVDVPYWANEVHDLDGRSLADAALRHSDGVVVLAYRDSPDEVFAVAQPLLAKANAAERQVRIAVAAHRIPSSRRASFSGHQEIELLHCLTSVDAQARRASPWFAGMAVHDDAGWSAIEAASG